MILFIEMEEEMKLVTQLLNDASSEMFTLNPLATKILKVAANVTFGKSVSCRVFGITGFNAKLHSLHRRGRIFRK